MPQILKTAQIYLDALADADIAANAAIQATKLVHQFPLSYQQTPGTAIVAATYLLYIPRAAGSLVSLDAAITTQATGADRTVSIDLQKSTGAGAFASVLTAPIGITNTTPIRTVQAATIASAAYIDNDLFELLVAVAGAAGAQAQGLLVTATFRENP